MNSNSLDKLKLFVVNLLVLILLLFVIETASYLGRYVLGKDSVGWLVSSTTPELLDDCFRMRTHPILSHVHDHKGQCDIKRGYASGVFVHYDQSYEQNSEILVTLGGSTTDGFYYQYTNGETYPYLLDKLLELNSLDVDVINGGNGAYGSTQELLKLLTEVSTLDLNIKYIVSLNGINEVTGYSNTTREMYEKTPFLTGLQLAMFTQQQWIIQNSSTRSRFLPSTISLIQYLLDGSFSDAVKRGGLDPSISSNFTSYKSNSQRWLKNVKAMSVVANTLGAEYYVFLQPTMGLKGTQSKINPLTPDGKLSVTLENNAEYLKNLNETYGELKKYCSELPYCFDITHIAPPVGDFYHDPRHHNKKGNALISKEIYETIFKSK